jgi:hypothetical protein
VRLYLSIVLRRCAFHYPKAYVRPDSTSIARLANATSLHRIWISIRLGSPYTVPCTGDGAERS